MVSMSLKLTIARGWVVLQAAIAALCLVAMAFTPVFSLRSDALDSSIKQSLWTTSIYTPIAEKHIPVEVFVKKCPNLMLAFQVAQVIVLVGIAALTLSFISAVFQMAPTPSRSNNSVCTACGVVICTLLTISVISVEIISLIINAMYEKNWCENDNSQSAPFPGIHGLLDSCNPFDGCINSFREMGFKTAEGVHFMWTAMGVGVTGLLTELATVVFSRSQATEAGASESTNLLRRASQERLL